MMGVFAGAELAGAGLGKVAGLRRKRGLGMDGWYGWYNGFGSYFGRLV